MRGIGKELSHNQFHGKAVITALGQSDKSAKPNVDAYRDLGSQPARQLDPWEQLAQVLLWANEFEVVNSFMIRQQFGDDFVLIPKPDTFPVENLCNRRVGTPQVTLR